MTGRASGGTTPIREREFHEWLAQHLPAGRSGLLPLGDDAAALRPPRGVVAVVSTDSLVEGTHFLRKSPPERVGAAAAAVSLSDLAAKGAKPAAVLLALIVPPGTPRSWAARVAAGAERMSARYGTHLVGGDTKPGPVRTLVSSALGWGRAAHLAPRSSARPGDLLVTTGVVGRGGLAAARFLGRRRSSPRVLSALLDVRPRVLEGCRIAPFVHAMVDTSDGVAEAAHLLSEASGVRVVVDEDRLPLAPGVTTLARSPAHRRAIAFFGGDYELFAALPAREWDRTRRAVRRVGGRITRVGRVEHGRGAWLSSGGRTEPMPLPGWRPFVSEKSRGL